MTLSRSNPKNLPGTADSSSHDPLRAQQAQAFPLGALDPGQPTATLPTSTLTPALLVNSTFDSNTSVGPLQAPTELVDFSSSQTSNNSHGPSVESGWETVDDESYRPDPPNPSMPKSTAPPFLRSAAGFASPSYGSISPAPELRRDSRESDALTSADTSSDDEDEEPASTLRKRRNGKNRVYGGRRSVRPSESLHSLHSEELGGSTTIGGLEGRFGVTETALPSDILSDTKDDSPDGTEDGFLQDEDESDEDDLENPPDNSPYPQVRASVSSTDNTTLSINTPRMWFLSTLFSILGSSTNLFFSLRYPSVSITPVIALLLVHPLGLLWDYFLKRQDDPPEEYIEGVRTVDVSAAPPSKRTRLGRLRLWLAQGRWNEKEHSCVYVSSNVSFGFAFATDVIVEQTQFYKQDVGVVYQLLLTLSTQILGYTFAGLTRRFLVRPSGMIWPGTLMSAAMFTTLHKEENKEANGWKISRWKFFYVIWLGGFLFYFLPGLLFPALSYFNVITWFAPDNVVVSNLFGVVSGLGLFPLTFDWAQIAYIGSPLLTPFWAAMNVVGGLVIVMWIIAPIAYYSNWMYSSYMPILSAAVFDNTGEVYNVSKILTKDFLFDKEAYQNYSRVFLPITYVLSYGVQFAGLASLLTHTACWHGKDIWTQWKRSLQEAKEEPTLLYRPISRSNSEPRSTSPGSRGRRILSQSQSSIDNIMSREDVHNRLMRRYKDAPMMWYLMTFISMTAIGIFVCE
jgi:hypothetical protein